jgi:NADP-reducing hydrogenase subunit HndA
MAKRKTMVAFNGTPEQEAALREFMAEHKDQEGALMPVLQKAQEIYGYLPIEVQYMIAREFKITLEKVYGVMSFYSHFTLNPSGKYNISVCMGTACYVKGAGQILDRVEKKLGLESGGITDDGMFSLDSTRCIGACGLAPVITVNGDVYGQIAPDEVDGIIDKYLKEGGSGDE